MPVGIYVRSEEHKRNLGLALQGKKRTDEQRRRMSESRKGIPSKKKGLHFPQYQGENAAHWKGGKPHCIECGKEIKYGALHCYKHSPRIASHSYCGEIHYGWKGDNVSLSSLHDWIKYHKPKVALCECCHTKPPYDCANISGKYLRDINDYEWLCRRCHMVKDGRLEAARLRAPYTKIIHNIQQNCGDW